MELFVEETGPELETICLLWLPGALYIALVLLSLSLESLEVSPALEGCLEASLAWCLAITRFSWCCPTLPLLLVSSLRSSMMVCSCSLSFFFQSSIVPWMTVKGYQITLSSESRGTYYVGYFIESVRVHLTFPSSPPYRVIFTIFVLLMCQG